MDNVQLFTHLDMEGSTIGVAYLGQICGNNRYNTGIDQTNAGTGTSGTAVVVVAHEMGHNFDMQHDGTGNTCATTGTVMAPQASSNTNLLFSSCSATYVNAYESGGGLSCASTTPPSVCGDGTCELSETSATCIADCPAVCGDGDCASTEDEISCADDCACVLDNAGVCCDTGAVDRFGACCATGMLDCYDNCVADFQVNWVGDNYCDDGTYGLFFDCPEYSCDGGDCACGDYWTDCSTTSSDSACSASCGGGTLTRTFSTTPATFGGSDDCPADGSTETLSCNTDACVSNTDCVGSWGSWTTCDASCEGSQSRVFTETVAATGSGATCTETYGAEDTDTETQGCNTELCPVDCDGSWSTWSTCDATCGGGGQSRVFTESVAAANGGDSCTTLFGAEDTGTETQPCNTEECVPCLTRRKRCTLDSECCSGNCNNRGKCGKNLG